MKIDLNTKFELFKTHKGSNRATYLRALAAIGVLTIHYGGLGLRQIFPIDTLFGLWLNRVVNFGGQGPTIFFVASGFVLQRIYHNKGRILKLLLNRYFRLAPAYVVVSIFAIYTQDLIDQLSLIIAFKKIFFLDIFFQDAYAFNPIGIGYFVVIEFWLTLMLAIYHAVRIRDRSAKLPVFTIAFLTFSILASYLSGDIASALRIELFQLDYLKYQFFFVIGAFTYDLKTRIAIPKSLQLFLIPLGGSILFLDNYLGYIAATISVVVLLTEEKDTKRKPIIPLIAIGNICYSIYLVHIPLLRIFESISGEFDKRIIVLLVLLFATTSYLIIEVPFIKLGKFLSKI